MGIRVISKMISDGHTYTKYMIIIPFIGEFKFRISYKNKLKNVS